MTEFTGAPIYGFYPQQVKQAKQMIRELARVLLTGRPDAEFLRPKLISTLTVELNDFVRYNQHDASEGFASPEARKQFMEERLAKLYAWQAQPDQESRDAEDARQKESA